MANLSIMTNVVVRCLILLAILLVTFGVQLTSLSSLINNRVDADQDKLKNVINYFATVCGALMSVALYLLGSLFTRDISWHLNERPGNKRFNRAWGFSPQLPAIIDGIRIGGKRWIIIGAAMTLITAFTLIKTVWISLNIKILPHVTYSNPLNVTISSIHNGFNNAANFTQKGKLSAFASSVMVGMKDKTVLHSDNGEYIWSPWLTDPNVAEVIFANYTTVGLRPNCTLLKQSQVNVTYNANTLVVEFDLAPSLYNTSEVDSAPTLSLTSHKQSSWSSSAVYYTSDHSSSPRNYSVIFHAFTSDWTHGNKTFTYNSSKIPGYADSAFLAYIYRCRIDINTYNISGHLTSDTGSTLDRLQLINKVPLSVIPDVPGNSDSGAEDPNNPIYDNGLDMSQLFQKVDLAVRAFAEVVATARPSNDDIETCVPIQCWMYDSIPGIFTGYNSKTDGLATTTVISYGWRNMTRDLIEYKTVQAIGFIISPNLLGVADNMTAFNITHDYVLETSRGYIFGGVAIQLFLILVVVVVYIGSVSDINRYHADDLDYLVGLIKKEAPNELYDLKTEINDEEQQPLQSTTIQ